MELREQYFPDNNTVYTAMKNQVAYSGAKFHKYSIQVHV